MLGFDASLMRAIAPYNSGDRGAKQAVIINAVGTVLKATLDRYAINTNLRAAHFLAQTCHESDGFVTTEEYASGAAYEGRPDLGNTQPGDGPRYKGRGLIQLTGRANYASYGEVMRLDLVGHPQLAADPPTSLVIACEYWKKLALNALADRDDTDTITRRINGGLNGIIDRRACLARAKAALGLSATAAAPAPFSPAAARARPVLRKGDHNSDVTALQTALSAHGYQMSADGIFGPGTEAAVKRFQQSRGLSADGVVGGQTWVALGSP
jgi:putative chitinase